MQSKEYIEIKYKELCSFAKNYSIWNPLFNNNYDIDEVEVLIEFLEELLEINEKDSYFYQEEDETS